MTDFEDDIARRLALLCDAASTGLGQELGIVLIAVPLPAEIGPDVPILIIENSGGRRELVSGLLEEAKRRYDEKIKEGMN